MVLLNVTDGGGITQCNGRRWLIKRTEVVNVTDGGGIT